MGRIGNISKLYPGDNLPTAVLYNTDGAISINIRPYSGTGVLGTYVLQSSADGVAFVDATPPLSSNLVLAISDAYVRIRLNTLPAAGTQTVVTLSTTQLQSSVPHYVQEVPLGVLDSVNNTFYLSQTPSDPSTLQLYRNGLYMINGTDYTLSGTTITMAPDQIPDAGDNFFAIYAVAI
jgi:hypothetical protein